MPRQPRDQQHRQRLAERLVEVGLARLGDRVDQSARELADVLLHPRDRRRREPRQQQAAVLGVLRRVGLHRQQRPPVTDRRQHHAGPRGEALDVAADLVDVLVAARDPEAAPRIRVEHRAARAQLAVRLRAAGAHLVVVVVERGGAFLDAHETSVAREYGSRSGSASFTGRSPEHHPTGPHRASAGLYLSVTMLVPTEDLTSRRRMLHS